MGNGKSQETLDSVGLQTSSEKGAEDQEEKTEEGNYSLIPCLISKYDSSASIRPIRPGTN